MSPDSISSLFTAFRLEASIFHNAQYCGEWAVDTSGAGWASFHLVTHGSCYLRSSALEESVRLERGDMVIFPRDGGHTVHPGIDQRVTTNSVPSMSFERGVRDDGVGLLCGHFQLTNATANPLLAGMPQVVVWQADNDDRSRALAELVLVEALSQRPGSEAILNRLAESLFIAIRSKLGYLPSELSQLAAAMSDRRIGTVLDAVHAEPGKRWTLVAMAELATMSRSAFAARFKELLGVSPLVYLTRWRMQLAVVWLGEEGATIAEVAQRCGYDNESSFSKAYLKTLGRSPGRDRKRFRAKPAQ